MKNLLSIDTSGEYCSIALITPNQNYTFHEHRPREHANIALAEIERLLEQARLSISNIDMVVYGRGPGSFTGIRIAAGVAQGIALAADCQIIPVSTLQSLAWTAAQQSINNTWVAIDARMSEVYFASFNVDESGLPVAKSIEAVLPPKLIAEQISSTVSLIGNGWLAGYELPSDVTTRLNSSSINIKVPNALDSGHLARLLYMRNSAVAVPPELALPTYLRDNVTWDNKPKVGH